MQQVFIPRHKEVLKLLEVNIQLQWIFLEKKLTQAGHSDWIWFYDYISWADFIHSFLLIQEIVIPIHNIIETGNTILSNYDITQSWRRCIRCYSHDFLLSVEVFNHCQYVIYGLFVEDQILTLWSINIVLRKFFEIWWT